MAKYKVKTRNKTQLKTLRKRVTSAANKMVANEKGPNKRKKAFKKSWKKVTTVRTYG